MVRGHPARRAHNGPKRSVPAVRHRLAGLWHVVIAIAFIGPLRDPLKNVWVVEFGMIACVLVVPWVLIFAPLRGIPLFWMLIDCSFGVIGFIPLWLVRKYIRQLAQQEWH